MELYLVFLRIGAVNFGGGYAMLPLLQRDLAEDRGWTNTDELMDYFAIGQCTPGIIALNVSTFIGNKKAGTIGGIIATLGFLTAPIAVILLIAAFMTFVLILQAVLRLWKKSVVDLRTLILYLLVFVLTTFSRSLPIAVPAAVLVILSGAIGIALGGKKTEAKAASEKKEKGEQA